MEETILVRLIWALAIGAAGWLAYRLANRWILFRAGRRAGPAAGLAAQGQPAIVYFTAPDCVPCRTIQRPALAQVQQRLGAGLQVVEVNVYEQPDVAQSWGVLSVPTTFILDANGRPQHVNHGATPAPRLLEQLRQVAAKPER